MDQMSNGYDEDIFETKDIEHDDYPHPLYCNCKDCNSLPSLTVGELRKFLEDMDASAIVNIITPGLGILQVDETWKDQSGACISVVPKN